MTPESVEEIYELSPLQQGMLFHTIQGENPSVLVVQFSSAIEGGLDPECFRKGWQHAIATHAVLRSSFHWEDLERLYQVVHADAAAPWTELDWSGRDDESVENDFARFLAEDKQCGFDLATAPAMRLTLIRTGADRFRFVWTFHHIILDGWSFGIVLANVLSAYETYRAGSEPSAQAAPRFSKYIEWLKQQPVERAEQFWRNYLAGFESPVSIGRDAERAEGARGYAREEVEQTAEFTAALNAVARRNRLTLNTIAQGAWAVLLSRLTREVDVVWGTVVSGRPATLASADKTVGLFINSIPTRARIVPEQRLADWLRDLQRAQSEARTWEHASLFEIQSWSQVARPRQLFETLVVFESYPVGDLIHFPTSMRFSNARTDETPTHPINLVIIPGERLRFGIVYDADLYSREAVSSLLQRFCIVIRGIVENDDARISDLPWMTPEEKLMELSGWNQTATEYPRDRRIHELFEERARAYPDAIAVTDGAAHVRYRELDRQANGVAQLLASRGAAPGSFVGICLERSPELIAVILGVLKCGAAYLPIDADYPAERVEFMLADSRAVLLIEGASSRAAAGFEGNRISIDEVRRHMADSADAPHSRGTADSPAYLMYTSGSTGAPKGAVIPHRAVVRLVRNTNYIPLGPNERIAQTSNVSFDAATFEIWGALLNGATLVLMPPRLALDVRAFASALEQRDVTTLFITTALFNQFAKDAPWCFRSVRWLLFGGEAVDPRAVSKVLSAGAPEHLLHVYGPTESTTFATWHEVTEADSGGRTIPIGKPIANTTVYICGASLDPLPAGVTGEICIGGDGLATEYFARPELTAERFVTAPALGGICVYRTGDLGRRCADGSIEFIGRIDNQVKIRGFRIEPGEIESALRAHADVSGAAVTVRENQSGDKRLVAYVTGTADPAELRNHLRRHLPEFMIPAAFVVLDALPVNANGKIDRRALPEPAETEPASAVADANTSLNELESAIRDIWKEALGVAEPGLDENFFDLGGHSILLMRVYGHLKSLKQFSGRAVGIIDLFNYPTIRSLARYLNAGSAMQQRQPVSVTTLSASREPIAVIGMAGRFPGAADVDQLWSNLAAGIESIRILSENEMLAAGADPAALSRGRYVRAGAPLDGAEFFDAEFFGYNAREAEMTDPQHRVFLECAEECLELAGYDSRQYSGRIGVFAGCAMSTYLLNHLSGNEHALRGLASLQVLIGNDKDFLPTRVAYKLDLRGPAVNVQTACSTSLVAIHMACQSLRDGACEMALAGGVSILFPQNTGYAYQEDSILSPDGHCRTFDAQARGTVAGSGAAAVLLKPLSRAIADGDVIHAVILGSAINNDGANKAGYTAPGVTGQASVISQAIAAAGVDANTIGYIEAHGTGTRLGDPIEIRALNQALGGKPGDPPCAIGSIKTNLGHLDAAAGVASFIKAVLQLKNRQLAPSLHFLEPNPEMPIDEGRLSVNTELRRWEAYGYPLRAGVSSFGIGGTNAHVILEEAPARAALPRVRDHEVLPFSAKTESALERMQENLAASLGRFSDADLSDVAWILQTGRRAFGQRRAAVAGSIGDAVDALRTGENVLTGHARAGANGVAYLFPGQGAQYAGMGAALHEREPVFRCEFDRCADSFAPWLAWDLREICFGKNSGTEELLNQTEWTQPALFAIEYALARLWQSWGIALSAMMGHSIGEYVAATLAQVFSLDDAARIVAERGRLMQLAPRGAMLSVRMPEAELAYRLPGCTWIAAANSPSLCAVAGTIDAIAELEHSLAAQDITCSRLATSHAFHCPLLDGILDPFRNVLAQATLRRPNIPFISNVTGTWIEPEAAASPAYWVEHLQRPVRFSAGIDALCEQFGVLLECGPGHQLSSIARQQSRARDKIVVPSLDRAAASGDEAGSLSRALARLWVEGCDVDWKAVRNGERRSRVPLPAYPFERQRYFVEPKKRVAAEQSERAIEESRDAPDFLWRPAWSRVGRPAQQIDVDTPWLVVEVADQNGIGDAIARELHARGYAARTVTFSIADACNPMRFEMPTAGLLAERVEHVAFVASGDIASSAAGFYGLTYLARAIADVFPGQRAAISAITCGAHAVTGEEALIPEQAPLLGPCTVIPQEFAGFTCRNIDIDPARTFEPGSPALDELVAELTADSGDAVVALRGRQRWRRGFSPVRSDGAHPMLRRGGVYLVTGGFGGIGLEIANYLASSWHARLVLMGRRGCEPGSVAETRVRAIEQSGHDVLSIRGDMANIADMNRAVSQAEARFGRIDGVIHAAGAPGGGAISWKQSGFAEAVFAPKVAGLRNLAGVFRDRRLDFLAICSSLASVLGGYGQVDYCAANAFEDAFAASEPLGPHTKVFSIGWDTWKETGMAVATALPGDLESGRERTLSAGLLNAEGITAFERIMGAAAGHVLVSKHDLNRRIAESRCAAVVQHIASGAARSTIHVRPSLGTVYIAPRHDLDRALAGIWGELLGVDPGIHDDFFDLGGHSLMATQAIARIRELFQTDISLRSFLEHNTIDKLGRLLVTREPVAGQTEAIASMIVNVQNMSADEVESTLEARASTAR